MGFFDNLFSKAKPDKTRARETFRFIEGYSPTARTFQGEIYESELIRASIDAHGRHSSKLKISSTGSSFPRAKVAAWASQLFTTAIQVGSLAETTCVSIITLLLFCVTAIIA